ncbi:MAG: hypothetical protein GY799_17945, partial [Desulfobulbaceae bacterium]|nr:hypothetical protein [Desulfobulbaceae bacterium]
RKTVVYAVIVRQKKEYKRPDGTRVSFEDNAAVVLKDEKGNPKGTIFKGPIAKESASRFPAVAKVASITQQNTQSDIVIIFNPVIQLKNAVNAYPYRNLF